MTKQTRVPVTLINREYPEGAHLTYLIGQGPKYLNTVSVFDGREGQPWKVERSKHLVIQGHRQDIVDRCHQMVADYRRAVEQHHRDRVQAVWDFESQWDKEHPFPRYPSIEEMVGSIALVGVAPKSKA